MHPNTAIFVQALQSPPQDAIKSFFLPSAASQLGCDWCGMSLRQSRQVFLRYRQPWLMMHVRRHALLYAGQSVPLVRTRWHACLVPRVPRLLVHAVCPPLQ